MMENELIDNNGMNRKTGKVGLLTLDSRSYNYGGLLQEYALMTIIKNLGYICEIIDYDLNTEPGMFSYKRSLRYLSLEKVIKKFKDRNDSHATKGGYVVGVIQNRHARFEDFRKNYMAFSPRCNHDDLLSVQKNYNAVVCGSDQIWSPSLARPSYFFDFVDDTRNKVIYAASISRNTLTREEARVYKKYLDDLTHVSVREEKAKELIHDIKEDLSVEVVLDPTLLLEPSLWKKNAGISRLVAEKYVFCYFLGIDEDKRKAAAEFAAKNKLKIVSLPFLLKKYNTLDEEFSKYLFPTGPIEFLNLILHADYILTDSFHASVFSILFNKQFRVFSRTSGKGDMNSRLDTLLSYVGHNDFLIEPAALIDSGIENSETCDMTLIMKKRSASIEWLKKSLCGV